eukprot:TRINITY_DN15110_c0_g1_i1.p1 TRINITY_DN15110_c0_g1~~TRINITY_DN15110_c0_g1_i1.p1  ORF type:complete len:155 (+),score=14.72 TRINITY_DN15110_c0_g1_i1:80-544(+)
MTNKEYTQFWEWIGPSLKKIRYQKHILGLFEQGYFCAFLTRIEAEQILVNKRSGSFILRLSTRYAGEFVVSYLPGEKLPVRHYLIKATDTADKKKTIADFLGQYSIFKYIVQVMTLDNGETQYNARKKDDVLRKYKRKSIKQYQRDSTQNENPL